MKILGISGSLIYSNHDAAAALVIDGKLVGNYEEERFNRIKHSVDHPFPKISIDKLLKENNLTIEDIDLIVIPHDPNTKEECLKELGRKLHTKKKLNIAYHSHHMAHICDSVFQSGFKSCACLIVDGQGDQKDGVTLAHYKDDKIKLLKIYDFKKSLGTLYSSGATVFMDLGPFGEGKLMGLSSYGIPNQLMPLAWKNNDIEAVYEKYIVDDRIETAEMACTAFLKRNCFPYRSFLSKEEDNIMYFVNTAASIQKCYSDIFVGLVKYLKELTQEDNLILSGGCIQNCIANNLAIETGLFKNVFAGPAPHDGGCAAGLAFYGAYISGENIINERLKNSYVGKTYSEEEILSEIGDCETEVYDEDKLVRELKNNTIIAWFQGGSEIGPRALGHRSILASPADRENLFTINNTIKHRENWRPLAPIVPAELFDLIFDVKSYDLTEFMLRTLIIRPEWRKKLTSVCHIDNSTRPQRLEKEQNPELYSLLMKFYKETGIPCLINTSFNGRGQPIIETPKEAIQFMKKTKNLDEIVFNSKWVVKNKG